MQILALNWSFILTVYICTSFYIHIPFSPNNNRLYHATSRYLFMLPLTTVRGYGICPESCRSPSLFYQSQLTSQSGPTHPHRNHMRKALKTFLASTDKQWRWFLLRKSERTTTHPKPSLPLPLWRRGAGMVLGTRLVWHKKQMAANRLSACKSFQQSWNVIK